MTKVKASHKTKGPQRNRKKDLEKESVRELHNVLTDEYFEIRVVENDMGVDLEIELKNSEIHLGSSFAVQIKATEKSRNKKQPSVQVETDNVEYLLSQRQLSMYILYVKETKTFYYQWTADFVKTLRDKKPNWMQQETVAIQFNQVLNPEAAKLIYDTVLKESASNRRERDFLIEGELKSVSNSIHEDKKTTVLEDFEHLFKTFQGLAILPMHILQRLPPFTNSIDSHSYYSETEQTLYSDNPALLTFFESLTRKGNKVRLSSHTENAIDNRADLLKSILNFFYKHSIHHINNLPEKSVNKRICIHKLYVTGSCDCERCRFYNLDITGSLSKVNTVKPKTPYGLLRNAHTHLELGNLKESFQLYKKLIEKFKKNENYVAYFMCKYTLANARQLYRWNYFGDDSRSIDEYINGINLDDELYIFRKNGIVKDEVISVLKWILQGSFINYANREMDEKRYEIDSTYENDKLGGWTSADYSPRFLSEFLETKNFVEFNLIAHDVVAGYSLLLDKTFTGAIKLNNLLNENNTAMKGVDSWLLRTFLLQGSSLRMNQVITRHNVTALNFEGKSKDRFLRLISNFISSFQDIERFVQKDSESPNYFFIKKMNDVIRNTCVLLSVLELSKEELNKFLKQLILGVKDFNFVESSVVGYLVNIINRKYEKISPTLLDDLYVLALTEKKFKNDGIKNGVPNLLRKHFPDYTRTDQSIVSTLDLLKADPSTLDVYTLAEFWVTASDVQKLTITRAVGNKLEKHFNFDDYYIAALRGVIDFKTFLPQAIAAVPKTDRERENERYFLQKVTRNRRINFLIDLAFKYKVNLKEKIYQKLAQQEPYFIWLMNLSGFNYNKFNPMWLLEFHSDWYFEEFKKHDVIKKITQEYILRNPVEGLVKIYVKHFSN
ncbi:hypothetical protein WSM22_40500 [Cytophagales bacterium WSM2-2]|nr:hypothetical protein WSM22_40500 [Cytophagales bacterium WSM2-2]